MKTEIITKLIVIINLINVNTRDTISIITEAPGELLWPNPFSLEYFRKNYYIDITNFKFVTVGKTCDILQQALSRYKIIIQNINDNIDISASTSFDKKYVITYISVNMTNSCDRYPHLNMDEWYKLYGPADIYANSIWGILRGLETYSQLLTPISNQILQISDIRITDSPRFSHRGLLLDTARHYIHVNTILLILDGMAYNKLNVFHWHIVDDQSFPYQSKKFPELSRKGAYVPSMIYTQKNISFIIEYARMRGIRVLPEFEVLGHTKSWGISHPELLTECGNKYYKKFGPINPISAITYEFLQVFFSEIHNTFRDKFIHIGGKEIDCNCWENNKEIYQYIITNKLGCKNLQQIYIERVASILIDKHVTAIAWQESIDANILMPIETIVQVWFGDWRKLLKKFSELGRRVILSECWYNFSSENNWKNDYLCEPYDFQLTENAEKYIIGGEACIWTKYIGDNNVLQKIFPRISAIAEKLWSIDIGNTILETEERLKKHTCRMMFRGIPATPISESDIC